MFLHFVSVVFEQNRNDFASHRNISLYCDDINEWTTAIMKDWFVESCCSARDVVWPISKRKTLSCFGEDLYEYYEADYTCPKH